MFSFPGISWGNFIDTSLSLANPFHTTVGNKPYSETKICQKILISWWRTSVGIFFLWHWKSWEPNPSTLWGSQSVSVCFMGLWLLGRLQMSSTLRTGFDAHTGCPEILLFLSILIINLLEENQKLLNFKFLEQLQGTWGTFLTGLGSGNTSNWGDCQTFSSRMF